MTADPPRASRPPRASGRALAAVAVGWVALVALGCAAFRVPGASIPTGQRMGQDRALFTAVNAATLTGFRQGIADVGQYRVAGQVACFALTVGGVGLCWVVGGAFVGRIAGRQARVRALLAGTGGVLVAVAGVGAVVGWVAAGRVGGAWPGAFDAVSAVGNSGLRLDPTRGPLDGPARPWLLALSVLGGLGPVVLIGLVGRSEGGRPSLTRHGRAAVAGTAGAYLLSVGLLMFTLPGGWDAATLADASAASADARSAGFDVGVVGASRAADWATTLLMTLGTAPGGTGGGVGVTTVLIIAAGAWRAIRGGRDDAGDRRTFGIALAWLAAFGTVVFAGQAVLLATFGRVPGDRSLLLVVSAATTTGLSHEPVSAVGTPLHALSGLMLAGRLLPLGVLAWLAAGSDGAREGVAVG